MNSLFLELRFSKLSAILSIIFLFSVSSKAQNTIKGEVVNAEEEPLIGATILWKHDATVNAVADIDGKFSINRSKKSDTLVVSYVGFNTLNFIVNRQDSFLHLHLEVLANLQEVVVTGRLEDSYVSTLNVKNVESLTSCELRKAPCCNLSEPF
ncbi:MAG: carboxypeptidase-like regulatory domain-containing protein [Saprospiraceae bacterium]|nr:carboxypeptidase-like regulatory domain-containing protein [Saprospiraceae bacterium]